MSGKVVSFELDSLDWRPVLAKPDNKMYRPFDTVEAVREEFKDFPKHSCHGAEFNLQKFNDDRRRRLGEDNSRYEKFKEFSIGWKRLSPDEFSSWPHEMAAQEAKNRADIAALREEFKNDPEHICHGENFHTPEFGKSRLLLLRRILTMSVGDARGFTIDGASPSFPADLEKFVEVILRHKLGPTLLQVAMDVQNPSYHELFT